MAFQLTFLALRCIKRTLVTLTTGISRILTAWNFEDIDSTVGKHFFLISHQIENIAHVHFNFNYLMLSKSNFQNTYLYAFP